ncbi:MAG: hypothetical protein L3K16_05775 [Thermoplasmata archaeon]|nr:hypothetical protein [Thermoplasmata archaeon]
MVGETHQRIGGAGKDSSPVLHLPKACCDGLKLGRGDRVDLVFDDVLVVIPRPGRQADRVRQALAEED